MSEINIGSIVASHVHPNIMEKSVDHFIYSNNSIDTRDDVPLMVVKEISCNPKFDNKYNSQFGENIGAVKDEKKYLCAWYDSEFGVFKDKIFFKNQLVLLPVQESKYDPDNLPKVGAKVYLSTNKIESFKQYTLERFKNYRYKSPLLVIIDYKRVEEAIKYDAETGKEIKVLDKIIAKCQWFNQKSGKYSEEWLPLATICKEDFINDLPFVFFKDEERAICESIRNGSELKSTMQKVEEDMGLEEGSGFSNQRGVGKEFEWIALQSNDTIIMNPRIYIGLQSLNISSIQNKLFICDEEKYGQIDILARMDDQDVIVDIIKSSSIDMKVVDKWIRGEKITEEESATKNILEKYWNRILIHKNMINAQYEKKVSNCYFLLETIGDDNKIGMFIFSKNFNIFPI